MKKMTARLMSVLTSVSLCLTAVSAEAVITAADACPEHSFYLASGEERADTVYVSAAELEQGDVVIPVSVYMESEEWTDPCISYMFFTWEPSSWEHMRFQNPVDYSERRGETVTVEYSGGSFQTNLYPYMLSPITSRGSTQSCYTAQCISVATDYVVDRSFGQTVYVAENNQVCIEASF